MYASDLDLTDEVIKDYLVGRMVVAADETTITLNNDIKLTLEDYYDCICVSYEPRLKDYKNLIGSVVTAVSQEGDGGEGDYTITLFGDANKILGNIYVKGDPGSGCYGTCAGFSVSKVER